MALVGGGNTSFTLTPSLSFRERALFILSPVKGEGVFSPPREGGLG